VAQGARPAARGGAYCMGTGVSGQTGKAIQRDCQVAGNTLLHGLLFGGNPLLHSWMYAVCLGIVCLTLLLF
jgi:hypothetical protein